MTISTRLLLAASLCFAPLGWAAAQDQQQRDDQHQRDHQDQHQQEQHQQPQRNQEQQHNQQPQQQPGHAAPQDQHTGGPNVGGQGSGGPQFQRPAQNNAAPPAAPPVPRQTQNNAAPPGPPVGAAASPTPPSSQSQVQRFQRPPQNGGAAPTGSAQQQQQFQQRSVQRGGAAGGATTQAQPQQQQQQTTNSRANFPGNARSGNTASFAQHHGGAAPTQFDRGHFYGRDYAHFSVHEAELWHRGAWHHEFHDGRFGWWYAVDGIWYFYAAADLSLPDLRSGGRLHSRGRGAAAGLCRCPAGIRAGPLWPAADLLLLFLPGFADLLPLCQQLRLTLAARTGRATAVTPTSFRARLTSRNC